MRRLQIFFLTCCLVQPLAFALAGSPIRVFDEDDPLGEHYYDASVGSVRAPSTLTLAGPFNGKLIIVTNQSSSGNASGLLEWSSAPGGDWKLMVAAHGWRRKDIAACHVLEFKVNAPREIPAAALPSLQLQSTLNFLSASMNLSNFFPSGVDDDPQSWQTVSVPLDAFRPFGKFSLSQFQAVVFSQSASDGTKHTLWFDDIRVVNTNAPSQLIAPRAPDGLTAVTGDQTVSLYWNPVAGDEITYHVFRSTEPEKDFLRITDKPVTICAFADVAVANGLKYFYRVRAINAAGESADSEVVSVTPRAFASDDEFLELIQRTAFEYFWREANPANGLIRDRSQPHSSASIASVGFGLTALGIGVDHSWITREQAAQRALVTLKTFWKMPQGTNSFGMMGHKGWFYHFLEMDTAIRANKCELSSVDTVLLLAGILYCEQYFDQRTPAEKEIRQLARKIFNRVDWRWMTHGEDSLSMGWHPENGFIKSRWRGYNEAMIVYLLGIGASKRPLSPVHWENWTRTYQWQTHYDYSFVVFPPLFGHQYSHCWVDFRGIADDYLRTRGIDYFENSRRATLAQRAYAIANPENFPGYSSNVWGLTACDGPGTKDKHGYRARGTPPAENDDGTIAPTAAGGSMPFAPEECLAALRHFYDAYRKSLWSAYGFRDAFNLDANWWATDVIGIDQGAILLMIENRRTGNVWKIFMKNPEIRRGLRRAGFRELPETRRN